MKNVLRTIIDTLWVKARHPSIKMNGMHRIRLGTEINILSGGKMSIGKRVNTQRRVTLTVFGGKLTIGDGTSFNRNGIVICRDVISIGRYCLFGPNVVVYDHDHKYDCRGIVDNEYKTAPIIIEDNCWIGANVAILRGTHIGEGCVIGSCVVVKGNIPAHSVVTGNRELVIKPITDRG